MRELFVFLPVVHDRLRRAVRRSGVMAAAGLLALLACGFLLAALYMGLAAAVGEPLAAFATGLLLLLLAALVFLLGRRTPRQPGTPPADLAGIAAAAARDRPFETLLLVLIAGALSEQLGRASRR